MTTRRLALHQIANDRAGSALLALIILLGSLLGSVAPRWTTAAMDDAVRTTTGEHPAAAEIISRSGIRLTSYVDTAQFTIEDITANGPLEALFGDQRWAASTGDASISTGGAGYPGNLQRIANLRILDDLSGRVEILSGRLPEKVTMEQRASVSNAQPSRLGRTVFVEPGGGAQRIAIAEAVITADVAAALYLRVGDVIDLNWSPPIWQGVASRRIPGASLLGLRISGIVAPTDSADVAWQDAPTAVRPVLPQPGDDSPTTRGTLLSGPEVGQALAQTAGFELPVEWHIALDTNRLQAGEVDEVLEGLTQLEANSVVVRAGSRANYASLTSRFNTAFDDVLADFQRRASIAQSLAALGIFTVALLLLAVLALIIALFIDRRARALQLVSTRGAAAPGVAQLLAVQAALLCVPAALLGTAAAHALFGHASSATYAVPALLTLTSLVGIPWMGVRTAARRGRSRPEEARLRPSPRRLMVEAGVVVLALVGLWLLRSTPGTGRTDIFLAVVPGLVAAAVGLLTFRLVPHLVLGMSRLLAPARGVVAYLSTVQAARRSAGALLPLVAVLVAVSTGVFAGAVRTTVDHDQAVTSWQQVGGDIRVQDAALPLGAVDEVASLDGVRAVAGARLLNRVRVSTATADAAGRDLAVDLLAVDPGAWLAVTAGAPADPPGVHSLRSARPPSGTWPAVLAGSSADLEPGAAATIPFGERSVRVQIVDQVDTLPGVRSGSALLVPAAMVADIPAAGRENVLYIGGQPDLDELAEITGQGRQEFVLRSELLQDLRDEPVLALTVEQFRVLLVIATGLAALAVLLGLVATERGRSNTLAILRTLGLTSRQAASMMTWEVVPMTIAAALVGVGAGAAVGFVAEQRIALSTFSSGAQPSGLHLEPVTSIVISMTVGAAIVVSVALAVLVNRRARLGAVLRVGDQ